MTRDFMLNLHHGLSKKGASMLLISSKGRVISFTLPRPMRPRDFCREWFNATPDDEKEWGYRQKCIKLLAEVVGLEQHTVDRWGKGIEFAKMPPQYENTLSYAISLKRVIEAAATGNPTILQAVIDQLKSQADK
jgi:hypothetical protein